MVRTGATFADAVAEYMRWLEQDRARKPTTLRAYESIMRAHLLPVFGERRLDDITADEVDAWSAQLAARGLANATRLRILTCLFGVMKRAKRVAHSGSFAKWASLHEADLARNWRRARAQEPLSRIEPLA